MFQGLKALRLLNWDKFNFNARELDAVILTHAHLDHCGALPLLVKAGFDGPIFCTPATMELARLILLDSAKIQEEDAEYANKKGFSKHQPAVALYTIEDVEKTLPFLTPIDLYEEIEMGSLSFKLYGSGHILGAASVWVSNGEKTAYFSGDLGRYNDPLMKAPEPPQAVDLLVMESTYGHREHSSLPSKEVLKENILSVCKSRGALLIPSFSVGRSQNLLHEIVELKRNGEVPSQIPVYFNSPMGSEASLLYEKYASFHKLGQGQFAEVMSEVHSVKTSEDSKTLNESTLRPMIIVAASGMLTGGRVLHHVKAFCGDTKSILLLAGFQSAGTRGRALLDGVKEIKIHGKLFEVNCQIVSADSFSAHADRNDLLKWIQSAPKKPGKICLVHGEPEAAFELQKSIEKDLQIDVLIPKMDDEISL